MNLDNETQRNRLNQSMKKGFKQQQPNAWNKSRFDRRKRTWKLSEWGLLMF
jgi:hypothetical protein